MPNTPILPPPMRCAGSGEIAGLAGAALAVPTVAVLRVLAGDFAAACRSGAGMA